MRQPASLPHSRFLVAVALLLLCFPPEVVWAQAPAPVRGKNVAADATPVVVALVELTGAGDSAPTSATGEFLPGSKGVATRGEARRNSRVVRPVRAAVEEVSFEIAP